MKPCAFLAYGSWALGAIGHGLLPFVVVFVTEHFLPLTLLAQRLPSSKGVRREPPGGDREHLLALLAGHSSL